MLLIDVKLLIFNEIRKYLHLYLRPTSGLFSAASSPRRHCQLGARCPNLAIRKGSCICLSRHRALPSKCRRGDASPPGEDASPPGEDALPAGEDAFLTRAYVRVHNIYLETFFVPCFIFITQCIDNQYFQEMKHWHSMFHF